MTTCEYGCHTLDVSSDGFLIMYTITCPASFGKRGVQNLMVVRTSMGLVSMSLDHELTPGQSSSPGSGSQPSDFGIQKTENTTKTTHNITNMFENKRVYVISVATMV